MCFFFEESIFSVSDFGAAIVNIAPMACVANAIRKCALVIVPHILCILEANGVKVLERRHEMFGSVASICGEFLEFKEFSIVSRAWVLCFVNLMFRNIGFGLANLLGCVMIIKL